MILLVLLAALAACLPLLMRRYRQEQHRLRLASQLRLSLHHVVHALRVGVSLPQAIAYAAKECPPPLGVEWQFVMDAVRLGQPLSEALEDFAQRLPLKEARWFVTAVQITQTTGGALTDVLDSLAATLEERQTLREKIGALTAQGKASGILLMTLPYALMGAFYVLIPDLARPLFTTAAGQSVIAGVTVCLAVGGLVIKKIVTIPVD